MNFLREKIHTQSTVISVNVAMHDKPNGDTLMGDDFWRNLESLGKVQKMAIE